MTISLCLPEPVCYGAVRLVRRFRPARRLARQLSQAAYFDQQYASTSALYRRFMSDVPLSGRTVLDVGSGLGGRAPYFLELGARTVTCLDVNRQELAAGAALLAERFPELSNRVAFVHPDDFDKSEPADVAVLADCFEHLVAPDVVLDQLCGRIRRGGVLWIGSIGWYHYAGSHCLAHIPIPWCQLLFSERTMLDTIRRVIHARDYEPNVWERLEGLDRWDGVETLRNRPGEPLNMLSLRRVHRVLEQSPFDVQRFTVHGFGGNQRKWARAASWMARLPIVNEAFHSYYSAVLVKR